MMDIIPNQFLFVFGLKKQSDPFHLCFYLCIESCFQVNQPGRILFFYRHEPFGPYWDLAKKRLTLIRLETNSPPWCLRYGWKDHACRKYRYAHWSDFIRLETLLEYGGIYADIDTIFVNEFPKHLFEKPFVLGREHDVLCQKTGKIRPSLCNALIMSSPHSEFGRLWLEEMPRAFDGSWSNHSTFLPQRLSEERPNSIHIEESRSFYKHMWTREGIRTLLEGCDADFQGIYSMHLWSHLWWSEKRKDYSLFHNRLLTERYVREKDTTYAIVARRFLP